MFGLHFKLIFKIESIVCYFDSYRYLCTIGLQFRYECSCNLMTSSHIIYGFFITNE